MATLLLDLRYGVRSLLKTPGLTIAAILSLALGIGANTTIFTWVQAVLLRPIPGASDPGSLSVAVLTSRDGGTRSWSYPNYRDVRDRATRFDVVAQDELNMSVAVDGLGERAFGALVSGNYFQVMGVAAAAGRLLTPEDDRTPGGHPVVVLSYPYWQRRFAANPDVVGQQIVVNNVPLTVIGVAQAGFIGSFMAIEVGAWVPMAMQPQMTGRSRLEARGDGWMTSWVRARPGTTRAQASAEIDAIVQQLARDYPQANEGRRAAVVPAWKSPFGAPVVLASMLAVLSGVVMLVLAMACANVANLLLSRAVGRRREMAIRLSLGASRWRLLRQLLTESLLLALVSGAAGAAAVFWTSGLLMAFVPPFDVPIDLGLRVDGATLAFALAVSVLTGIFFGLAPAWQASRAETVTALKEEGGRGSGGRTGRRLRSSLVVVQVAVCLVLLVGAGLFMRSLAAAQRLDPGFDTAHQLTASLDLFPNGYTPESARQFHRLAIERMTALPGVASAAFSRQLPLGFSGSSSTRVQIDGYTPRGDEEIVVDYNIVSPRYFETMGIAVVGGREFGDADLPGAQRVVIINEAMARRYWGTRNPVGTRVTRGEPHVVAGVVRDIKYRSLDERPSPHMYFALAQEYVSSVTLQVRTTGDPLALVAPLRDAIRAIDPALPLWDVRPVAGHMQQTVFAQRIGATLLGAMSALALLLAAVGLYGVIAYAVSQRTQEMGIRLALGASPGGLQRMILGHGLRLAAVGLAVGLAAAFAVAPLAASLLPGIEPIDPVTFAAVPALLLAIVAAAAWLPARRASAVNPIVALRYD
jgi:predicted permease